MPLWNFGRLPMRSIRAKRSSSVLNAIFPSRRASCAPGQWWMPCPSERRGQGAWRPNGRDRGLRSWRGAARRWRLLEARPVVYRNNIKTSIIDTNIHRLWRRIRQVTGGLGLARGSGCGAGRCIAPRPGSDSWRRWQGDRLTGANHLRDIIAPERQSARAPERQSARAPERQSARAPERQSARAPGATGQSARAPERRAPERQSARATDTCVRHSA